MPDSHDNHPPATTTALHYPKDHDTSIDLFQIAGVSQCLARRGEVSVRANGVPYSSRTGPYVHSAAVQPPELASHHAVSAP